MIDYFSSSTEHEYIPVNILKASTWSLSILINTKKKS